MSNHDAESTSPQINMIALQLALTGSAIVMLLVSALIFRMQAKAQSCPLHKKYAGYLALIFAIGLVITALALLAYTWVFLPSSI